MSLTEEDIRLTGLLSRMHGAGLKSARVARSGRRVVVVVGPYQIFALEDGYAISLVNLLSNPRMILYVSHIEIDRNEEQGDIDIYLHSGEYSRDKWDALGDSYTGIITFKNESGAAE